jgi:hypothetical protein
MAEVFQLLLLWLLPIGLTYAAFRVDRRRLRPDQLAREWNVASTGVALLFFSPFCIVVHSWRTRRGLRGLAVGLLWLTLILAALVGISLLLDLLVPDLDSDQSTSLPSNHQVALTMSVPRSEAHLTNAAGASADRQQTEAFCSLL